jgi:hypothetical protein
MHSARSVDGADCKDLVALMLPTRGTPARPGGAELRKTATGVGRSVMMLLSQSRQITDLGFSVHRRASSALEIEELVLALGHTPEIFNAWKGFFAE